MFLIAIFFSILLLLSLNQQHILLYSYSLLIYEFYNILLFLSFYNKLYEPPSLKLNILHRMMPRKLLKAPNPHPGTADIIREIAVVATFVFFNPFLYKYFTPEYFIYHILPSTISPFLPNNIPLLLLFSFLDFL